LKTANRATSRAKGIALAGILLLALPVSAQQEIDGLPNTAFVIETQAIPESAHANRALVLWMERYEKIDHGSSPSGDALDYTCPDFTTGSGFYRGPTRISLIDTRGNLVLNTIKLEFRSADSFDLPFRILRDIGGQPGYYQVPGPLTRGEGKPALLSLKDYNGDGLALEAAFFEAEACMGLPTALIGYSTRQDRVIWYEVDLERFGEKRETLKWIDYLFAKKPVGPGHWKYSIDYRGRMGGLDKYEIRYDPERERFKGTFGGR
jgi:hypothetical protein